MEGPLSDSKLEDIAMRSPSSVSATQHGSNSENPSTPRRSTLAQQADRLKNMIVGSTNTQPDKVGLAQKMQYYSTMRVHMKRVQYSLLEERRNSFYKELVVYLVFLSIMMMTVLTLPIQVPFEHNEALNNVYLDQEFNNVSFKKNFYEVDAIDEMWQWFTDVLLDGYYNSGQLNTRRITSIQIRSARMKGISCSNIDPTNPLNLYPSEVCYQTYQGHEEDTTSYGDNGYGGQITYEKDLTLLTRSLQFTPSIFNARMDYGHGGYTIYLPRDNATAGIAIVNALKKSLVLPSTRYVAATWALYNPSSNVFTHLQVMFEISPTDHIELTQRLMSFQVLGYRRMVDFFTTENILILILFIVTLIFTRHEIESAFQLGLKKYTASLWNVLDILQLGCLYGLMYKWFLYLYYCHQIIPTLEIIVRDSKCNNSSSGKNCFINLNTIGLIVQDITNISACVALVSVAIVFKYLRLNSRLNMLWTTLRLAGKDLIAFVIIFIFIFFGYAVMGFLLFGSHVRSYRSISGSLAQCFQMLLGAFDFESLSSANPIMSVNMFIAILSEYYSIAQNLKRNEDENKKNLLNNQNIEYDIWKQIRNYLNELKFNVKLMSKEQIPLQNGANVLLIDYNYLKIERKRLLTKFRTSVRVILICLSFLRPLRKFFTDFDGVYLMKSSLLSRGKLSLRSKSSHHLDYRKFPVTYVPLDSKSAYPITMIEQLKPGDILEMDDGSYTFDRILLKVIGSQENYLNDDLNNNKRNFGLNNKNNIGNGTHIKCCRVIYQGDIILAGDEKCIVSNFIWLKYFIKRFFYFFISLFYLNKKKNKNTLISDQDISQLLDVQLVDIGRGQSCRFDELVRQFRLFLAKKSRKGLIRIPNNDLETCVQRESIAFVERFSKALLPLDKREINGYKYIPTPTDTNHIRLPNSISRLSELLAHNAHEVWSQGRIQQGWKWGESRDNEKKLHPDLIAYEQLSEEAKQYDRETSMEALKVIQALGYVMNPKHHGTRMTSQHSSIDFDIDFGLPVEYGKTYQPCPISTDDIELSNELNSLVELLAENTHDVWAKKRMEEGWVYGPKRNDIKKEHDGLVPYVYLTSEEKDMDRNTAIETVKCILKCGFIFTQKYNDPSAKFKMFGRSDDSKPIHFEEATVVAMNIQKAKNAFMNRRGHKTYGSVTFENKKNKKINRAVSVDSNITTPLSIPLDINTIENNISIEINEE